jgi:hypothetical protein
VCTLKNASAATCNGLTCSYTCNTGTADCNAGTAPDLDGCECTTPACCPGGTNSAAPCQTAHSNGLGNSYYDCNNLYTTSPNTYTAVAAMEACTAYALSQPGGKSSSNCSDGYYCGPKTNPGTTTVCYEGNPGNINTCTFCWGYSAPTDGGVVDNGWLETCSCPEAQQATYN